MKDWDACSLHFDEFWFLGYCWNILLECNFHSKILPLTPSGACFVEVGAVLLCGLPADLLQGHRALGHEPGGLPRHRRHYGDHQQHRHRLALHAHRLRTGKLKKKSFHLSLSRMFDYVTNDSFDGCCALFKRCIVLRISLKCKILWAEGSDHMSSVHVVCLFLLL